jgi:hypothetical protein
VLIGWNDGLESTPATRFIENVSTCACVRTPTPNAFSTGWLAIGYCTTQTAGCGSTWKGLTGYCFDWPTAGAAGRTGASLGETLSYPQSLTLISTAEYARHLARTKANRLPLSCFAAQAVKAMTDWSDDELFFPFGDAGGQVSLSGLGFNNPPMEPERRFMSHESYLNQDAHMHVSTPESFLQPLAGQWFSNGFEFGAHLWPLLSYIS